MVNIAKKREKDKEKDIETGRGGVGSGGKVEKSVCVLSAGNSDKACLGS